MSSLIVLSVLIRFTDSDYPFGIVKLFLNTIIWITILHWYLLWLNCMCVFMFLKSHVLIWIERHSNSMYNLKQRISFLHQIITTKILAYKVGYMHHFSKTYAIESSMVQTCQSKYSFEMKDLPYWITIKWCTYSFSSSQYIRHIHGNVNISIVST